VSQHLVLFVLDFISFNRSVNLMGIFSQTLVILGLVFATLVGPVWSQTNDGVRLYLQNRALQDEKVLIVDVVVANVTGLFSADIHLTYDPSQLTVRDQNPRLEGVQISPGPVLASDQRFVAQNMVDPETGQISFVFTLLDPAPPINDEAVLATIVFEVTGTESSQIEFSSVQLVSSDLEPIAVLAEDLALHAAIEATGQSGQSPAAPNPRLDTAPEPAADLTGLPTWLWGLAAALVGLVVAILQWRKRGIGTGADRPDSRVRKIPGSAHAPARTAALLTEQGHNAFRQGDLAKAYELFSQAIEYDPINVAAWLGKGLVAQQETEKRICFRRVLALEPDNKTAQAALVELDDRPGSS
jgi:hypothetical protein